jgi:hypothetical protein
MMNIIHGGSGAVSGGEIGEWAVEGVVDEDCRSQTSKIDVFRSEIVERKHLLHPELPHLQLPHLGLCGCRGQSVGGIVAYG